MIGKKSWIIPDGFLQPKSTGDEISHEAVCVLNLMNEDAAITLVFYFEDSEPMDQFVSQCGSQRTHHIRLDQLKDEMEMKFQGEFRMLSKWNPMFRLLCNTVDWIHLRKL